MLTEEHIKELTNIYGNFVPNEYCKIFDEDDFAYWKVTVERPLRLNFQVNEERIARIEEQTAFANLAKSRRKKKEDAEKEIEAGRAEQAKILEVLSSMDETVLYKNREEFLKVLKTAMKKNGVTLKANIQRAILAALSEKDDTADICLDRNQNPEPDPDLRDTEQIPIKEEIDEYVKREVLPYVPDAWVDESKTKKGYEIPFTRHFYKYVEIGDAEVTLRDIEAFGARIQAYITKLFEEV